MNRNAEWERFVGKMDNSNMRNTNNGSVIIQGIFSLVLVNAITAALLMFINMIAISAWPNIESINPGIGYQKAFLLSLVIWAWSILRVAILTAASAGAAMRARS